MNPKVDAYLNKVSNWSDEMRELRRILLDCLLTEELKWGVPCYTYNQTNIILIGGYKTYFTLSFVKGVLLSDPNKVLVSPGVNSQSVRMFKFTSKQEILVQETIIKTYVFEAIEVEKSGEKVALTAQKNLNFPQELHRKFETDPKFKAAFETLTPGRQRAYNIFFTSAKQAETRTSRIEKSVSRIMNGKGINDCVCGLSKKMPGCDGSHKYAPQAGLD